MTPDDLLYLDRFEEDRAVIIYRREEFSIPRSLLPGDSREGDYLDYDFQTRTDKRSETTDEIARVRRRLQGKGGEER